jgi:hypothetical protein
MWMAWMWLNALRNRQILRGSEDAPIVTNIAAQEYKCIGVGGCSGQSAQMADSMTGAIKKIERAVAKIVPCIETANL